MTISNEVYRHDFAGNGETVLFTIEFYFLVDAHIKATLYNSDTDVETPLELTTHYTLTGAGNPAGGELEMLVAPTSDESLTILRNVDLKQEKDYVEGAKFPAEDHETALDKLTMLVQQLQEQIDRIIRQAESYPGNLELPMPVEDYFLRWASNELVNFDILAVSTFGTIGPTDDVDVSGLNTLFLDCGSNAVTIGGFTGGVDGQVLNVLRKCASANAATLEHNEGGGSQDIFLHAGADEDLVSEYGGWLLVCDGTSWFDASHSKHV